MYHALASDVMKYLTHVGDKTICNGYITLETKFVM